MWDSIWICENICHGVVCCYVHIWHASLISWCSAQHNFSQSICADTSTIQKFPYFVPESSFSQSTNWYVFYLDTIRYEWILAKSLHFGPNLIEKLERLSDNSYIPVVGIKLTKVSEVVSNGMDRYATHYNISHCCILCCILSHWVYFPLYLLMCCNFPNTFHKICLRRKSQLVGASVWIHAAFIEQNV